MGRLLSSWVSLFIWQRFLFGCDSFPPTRIWHGQVLMTYTNFKNRMGWNRLSWHGWVVIQITNGRINLAHTNVFLFSGLSNPYCFSLLRPSVLSGTGRDSPRSWQCCIVYLRTLFLSPWLRVFLEGLFGIYRALVFVLFTVCLFFFLGGRIMVAQCLIFLIKATCLFNTKIIIISIIIIIEMF